MSGKQHDDFGEKIGGAKKDLWQKRGLLSNDISSMNEREAEKYVIKDNIWKKPDYQALIDSGISKDVVFFIKTVRDSIETKPLYYRSDNTPEKRAIRQMQYIDTVREIKEIVENVKTKTDVFEVFNKCMVDGGYIESPQRGVNAYYSATEKGRENPAITNKLFRGLLIKSEYDYKFKIVDKAEKQQFGISKENKIPKGFDVLFSDGKHTWSADNDWKPNTYYVVKGRYILQKNFETKIEAIKWVQEFAEKRSTNSKKRFMPPQLDSVKRDGPDYRCGRDVDGSDYLNTFGFKGGEFGNWMTQLDRQASLNFGYDALKDLAAALKISDKDISYQGALSIAFGARGSGNAVAHYETLRIVINLTKMKGAGSLAHEWWHGLDDFLGTKMGIKGFLSNKSYEHPLMKKLIDTIKYKDGTLEQAAAAVETRNKRTKHNAESWLKGGVLYAIKQSCDEKALSEYEALKDAFLRGEEGCVDKFNDLKKKVSGRIIPKDVRERLKMYEHLLSSRAKNKELPTIKVETDYYKNSKLIGNIYGKDGGYWDSNIELTARAFATYVMDKLPNRSDYLCGHAECALASNVDKDGNIDIVFAFPKGEERQAINAVFDEFITELKRQQYLTHDDHMLPDMPDVEPNLPEIKMTEQTSTNEIDKNEQLQTLNSKDNIFSTEIKGQLSFSDIGLPINGKKKSLLSSLNAVKAALLEADNNNPRTIKTVETERG